MSAGLSHRPQIALQGIAESFISLRAGKTDVMRSGTPNFQARSAFHAPFVLLGPPEGDSRVKTDDCAVFKARPGRAKVLSCE